MSSDKEINDNNHAPFMVQMLKLLRDRDHLCDVILIAGADSQRLTAHRVVLAAASEYFAAMFTGSLREAHEAEVTIVDVQFEILHMLVGYCYNGCLSINKENVQQVLVAADLFRLTVVKEKCSDFMSHQLDKSNCLSVLFFAESHSCWALIARAYACICAHFQQLVDTPEFKQLNRRQLAELLHSDDLNIHPEENVFWCVMKWMQHNVAKRKNELPQLLRYLRVPLMEPRFVERIVRKVFVEHGCEHLCKTQYISDDIKLQISNIIYPGRVVAFGSRIVGFHPMLCQWLELDNVKIHRTHYSVVLYENRVIIAGGKLNAVAVDTVKSVDFRDGKIIEMPPMNTARYNLSLCVANGVLYALGGIDNENICLRTAERYSSHTKKWEYIAKLPVKLNTLAVAPLNGRMYIAGNNDGYWSIQTYTPDTNQWHTIVHPWKISSISSMTEVNGCLYAFGTTDNFQIILRFDSYSNSVKVGGATFDADWFCGLGSRLVSAMKYGKPIQAMYLPDKFTDSALEGIDVPDEVSKTAKEMPHVPLRGMYGCIAIPKVLLTEAFQN